MSQLFTKTPKGRGPVVVAAGAGMTQGTLGRDWVGDLREKPEFRGYAFINADDNGNTGADLHGRVDSDIVACNPDSITLLIGTNDVRDGVRRSTGTTSARSSTASRTRPPPASR